MLSAVYVLDSKGKILISRDYRGDVSPKVLDRFAARVIDSEDTFLKPVFEEDGINYIYVKYNSLIFLATTIRNTDTTTAVLYLYKLIEVLKEYFTEVEEESIRDNFVIIYELLDETADFGYPQVTEPKLLKEFITQQGHSLHKSQVQVPKAITGRVSWRADNIQYKKNEVFLDVIEQVNLLVSATGVVLRSEINGKIQVKAQLSADSEDRGKKPMELEDVKFHQCVQLRKVESDKTIIFVPPDGDFELMSYRLSTRIKPLIWVQATVESHKHSRVEYLIKAKAQFKNKSVANNVVLTIPVPADADTPQFHASIGTVEYVPAKDAILWTIKQFSGGREYALRAHFGLPSIEAEEQAKRPPITVKFEIPYFTVSGIAVRYLRFFSTSNYQALPWVRYLTQAGDYSVRMV